MKKIEAETAIKNFEKEKGISLSKAHFKFSSDIVEMVENDNRLIEAHNKATATIMDYNTDYIFNPLELRSFNDVLMFDISDIDSVAEALLPPPKVNSKKRKL